MLELIRPVADLWAAGGFVMPPLFALTVVLWWTLGWRMLTLRRGERRSLQELVRAARSGEDLAARGIMGDAVARVVAAAGPWPRAPYGVLDAAVAPHRAALSQGRVLVHSIVAVAPLLGLLGTVTGMIETFRSLSDMTLFSQGGGIAGGIAEALLTTQMGLAVAVPGIVVGRLLDRKAVRLGEELDQLCELVRVHPQRRAA